eukprot:4913994-Prymnesium_polylepis.1
MVGACCAALALLQQLLPPVVTRQSSSRSASPPPPLSRYPQCALSMPARGLPFDPLPPGPALP